MFIIFQVAAASLAILAAILVTGSTDAAKKRVVCYYTNWSTYRQAPGKVKYIC